MFLKRIVAIMAFVFTIPAFADTQVKMVWPFGQVAAANLYRHVIEQANASQKQFQFNLDLATGGGGTIAVNTVANSTQPAVLAHSAAFFVNPRLTDPAPYQIENWRVVRHICDVQYPLVSIKYKNLNDLPKDRPVTIGVLGLGTTTHLVAQWFVDRHPNLVVVPYKTATAALTDVIGGHLDITVTLPGDAMGHIESGSVSVLGVTGPRSLKNIPTFASQGYKGTEYLVGSYYIFVNKKVDVVTQESWKRIFNDIDPVSMDRVSNQILCTPSHVRPQDLDDEFVKNNNFWSSLAGKIKR